MVPLQHDITHRFDWYSASIDTGWAMLATRLSEAFRVEPVSVRATNSFTHALAFSNGARGGARLQWKDKQRPFVESRGAAGQTLYEMLQDRYLGDYAPARLDAALDFHHPDWFEVISPAMLKLSMQRGVTNDIRGDWDTPGSPKGRTRYAGSFAAAICRRLYEHAKCHGFGNATRYELQVKPSSRTKASYSGLSAIEVIQRDSYSVTLLRTLGLDLALIRSPRSSTVEPSRHPLEAMLRQYGPTLLAFIESSLSGDLSELGPTIHREIQRISDERRLSLEALRMSPQGANLTPSATAHNSGTTP
jgi:hypothetical protein